MSPAKHEKAAALVRRQVTSGTLPPGAPAPSGAQLASLTGYSVLTCRRALRTLVTEGTLTTGASRNARPRVPAARLDGLPQRRRMPPGDRHLPARGQQRPGDSPADTRAAPGHEGYLAAGHSGHLRGLAVSPGRHRPA